MSSSVKRLYLAEHGRVIHLIEPEKHVTFEEILQPSYWVHVSEQLKPGDMIEVRPEGLQWFAVLMVRAVGVRSANVMMVQFARFGDVNHEGESNPPGYYFKLRGKAGWCVIRISDDTVLHNGSDTREMAIQWLFENVKE